MQMERFATREKRQEKIGFPRANQTRRNYLYVVSSEKEIDIRLVSYLIRVSSMGFIILSVVDGTSPRHFFPS